MVAVYMTLPLFRNTLLNTTTVDLDHIVRVNLVDMTSSVYQQDM